MKLVGFTLEQGGPPSNITDVLRRRGNVDTHTHTKRTPCGKGGGEEGCFYKPRNTKDGQQTTRHGVRGLGQSPQQSSDETNSVDTWTSDFWPPDPGDSKCLLFSLGYFAMPALGNKCITLLRNRVSCSFFILLKTFF